MVRVIAGRFRSRRLKTVEGRATRPTSDRLKETLFDLLQSGLADCCFLDCFAGCGSIGIEALSRGAKLTVFVESSVRASQVIRSNLALLELSASPCQRLLTMKTDSAFRILEQSATRFDIVFLDPPYSAVGQYPIVLEQLRRHELLTDSAIVIAEHSKHIDLAPRIEDLVRFRRVQQGDNVLSLFRRERERITTL
jgi:16S rRNA (guanine966-N2)-methyltransferase